MAGRYFDYLDGYLRVEFRHGPWSGDMEIIFHVHGDTVVTTPCNDRFEAGESEVDVAEDATFHCWTSSTVSRFFYDMVHWLEAVACDVSECAFGWDGEGPDGELRWRRGFPDGSLEMSWTGRSGMSPAFEHRVRLNKAQMVRAFYQSFRGFVESDHYNPFRYEDVTCNDCFTLVIEGGALETALVERDRRTARAIVDVVLDFAYRRSCDPEAEKTQSLPFFLQQAADRLMASPAESEPASTWFGEEWDGWSTMQRRRYLADTIYPARAGIGFGERLRELRSPLVEAWLAGQGTSQQPA